MDASPSTTIVVADIAMTPTAQNISTALEVLSRTLPYPAAMPGMRPLRPTLCHEIDELSKTYSGFGTRFAFWCVGGVRCLSARPELLRLCRPIHRRSVGREDDNGSDGHAH